MFKFLDPVQNSIRNHRILWLPISFGVVLVIAALVRLWSIGAESAWIDEAYSIELAKHSIIDIIKGTAADQHPPFYYLLLHAWFRLGSGIVFARLLSVVLGVINVAQTMHFGYKSGGIYIALVGGLLLAISPMHVWYSQEIRMYILLACLTTAAATSLWWALESKRMIHWILYSIFSILAIYTHYFAFFPLAGFALWIVIRFVNGYPKNEILKWVVSTLIILLTFLPWLPTAINQARYHSMTWVESPTINLIRDTLLRLLFGIAVLTLPEILLWIVLVMVIGVFTWAFIKYLPVFSKHKGNFYYVISWGVIPFLCISAAALIFPVYQFKQYLIVLAPILLLSAWITYLLPRTYRIIGLIILILTACTSLVYQQVTLSKDDWKGATEFIQQNSTPDDALFSNPAAASLAFDQYGELEIPLFGIPENYDIVSGGWEGEMLTPDKADDIFSELAQTYQRVWLLEFFPEFWDEDKYAENWLNHHSTLVVDQNFGRIRIRIYDFNYD
ncbi:MAG: hypothetical protein ACK2UM_03200 [Anaerolineales bacterium]